MIIDCAPPTKEVVETCLSKAIKVRFDGDTIIATITRAAPGSAAEESSERADNYIMKKLRRERENGEPIIITPRALKRRAELSSKKVSTQLLAQFN
jgi:hypothetical protein